LPSTGAVVRLAKDWVDKINSADDAAYVRFVKKRGPVLLDGPERWLKLRDNLRGIQLCGVKSADANDVALWAIDPNFDSYAIMRFKPGATGADKIEFVFLSGTDAVPPGAVRPAKLALPALIDVHRGRRLTSDRTRAKPLISCRTVFPRRSWITSPRSGGRDCIGRNGG
jgi:hypothetical protein